MDAEDPDACREIEEDFGGDDQVVVAIFVLVIFAVCIFWPGIVFAAAYCTCIQPQKKQGRHPTGGVVTYGLPACPIGYSCFRLASTVCALKQHMYAPGTAWASCCLVFWLICVFGGITILPGAWLWGPFFMIIPFCLQNSSNGCYSDPEPTDGNNGTRPFFILHGFSQQACLTLLAQTQSHRSHRWHVHGMQVVPAPGSSVTAECQPEMVLPKPYPRREGSGPWSPPPPYLSWHSLQW
jgi:hypothetical protein